MQNFVLTWFNAFVHPKETFVKEKANASWIKAISFIIVAVLIANFFFGIERFVDIHNIGAWSEYYFSSYRISIYFVDLIIVLIFHLFLSVLIRLVKEDKIVKGISGVKEQLYLFSLFVVPLSFLSSIFWILPSVVFHISFRSKSILSILDNQFANNLVWGVCLIFLAILFLYGFYLSALSLMETYKISFIKAVITTVIAFVILLIVIGLFLSFLFMSYEMACEASGDCL